MLEKEFRSFMDRVIGIENIVGFREDFKERFLRNKKLPSKINKPEKIRNIKRAVEYAKERQGRIELIGFLAGGPLAILSSYIGLTSISIFLGIYWGILFPIELVLRKVTIDILAYKGASERMTGGEILFREAWNKRVLRSAPSLAGIPLVGLLMKLHRKGYEIGMEMLEERMS
ncbi:hypothetical protein AKJ58_01255 [candidate division MSBL1 archaeon SCGC-AAA385D11]|uniref:Uncharacterized protein n=1 Tax=candidate division MSBL1 archaeon SCGC-AAA385D11 TaxID=1698286 RepID=A0A133VNK3_9EURY|nr:hypothetical protein AKJ58_01255 [candidate division MSBL1 archaeon SCGC-AAA385D11]